MEPVCPGHSESHHLSQLVTGSCGAGEHHRRTAAGLQAVSGLMGKRLCGEMDSGRPCTQTTQNPHLRSFTGGRRAHRKDIICMVESPSSHVGEIEYNIGM